MSKKFNDEFNQVEYIQYLTIDDIADNVSECMDKKTRESLDNFRAEHIDMCYAHRDIREICELTPENATNEEMNEALDEIMDIAMQHTSYWREE